MKLISRPVVLSTLAIAITFLIPVPFWNIIWVDIILLCTIFFKSYRPLIITPIILIIIIEFLWILQYEIAANRLTHFAFAWTLMGIIKFAFSEPIEALKSKVFHAEGEIIGEIHYEKDPVILVVEETIIALLFTLVYVLTDIFVNPLWWI